MPKHFCSLIQYILIEHVFYARHVPRMREKAVNKTNLVLILMDLTSIRDTGINKQINKKDFNPIRSVRKTEKPG